MVTWGKPLSEGGNPIVLRGFADGVLAIAGGLRSAVARSQGVPCAMCLRAVQGNYSIHRDGMGVGPELPLCDACGGVEGPSCEEMWLAFRKAPHLIPKYEGANG